MIRDQETLNLLLDTISRFVRGRLVPFESIVSETDNIPHEIVAGMKALGLFGLSLTEEHGGMGLGRDPVLGWSRVRCVPRHPTRHPAWLDAWLEQVRPLAWQLVGRRLLPVARNP